ncbi:MAG: NAD-dependent epimerase/dehydratase family protein [Actinomycetota bacterium]|nr:SDR family NAD(P)-dependent oxidoreductase [Actinomycetota bacterium]
MSASDWNDVGAIVTGATGFIGGWLAEELDSLGARVFVVDINVDPTALGVHPKLWDSAVLVHGDVRDTELMKKLISQNAVSVVFHLAAQAAVGSALVDPTRTFESNIEGTWSVLEACRVTKGVERIVVASSDKAYGEHEVLPYKEDAPLLGRYPYDASKAAAEIITSSYHATYDLPVAVTRNANIYGGGDLSTHRLVPEVIQAIIARRRPVIRSDGTPERDYLFIKDAVSAYIALAEHMDDERIAGEAFNFGTGVGVSVIDLVNLILEIAGSDLEPDIRSSAPHELARQYLSPAKAIATFGWKVEHTLEQGLLQTIDWYKSRPDLSRLWSST